jgi:[protein-PII] uridylyltransferase
MEMFRLERGLLHNLRRMNLYGVLGQYLPVFGRIVGRCSTTSSTSTPWTSTS